MLCARKGAVLTTSTCSVTMETNATKPLHQKGVEKMEHITLLINRGKGGYGFTVSGTKPVTVGKIEPGSSSHQAGLEPGDNIERINGQNVAHLDMIQVAAIVKACDRYLLVDIGRAVNHQAPIMTSQCRNNGEPIISNRGGPVSRIVPRNSNGDIQLTGEKDEMNKRILSSSNRETNFNIHSEDGISYKSGEAQELLEPWKRVTQVTPWQLYHQLKDNQAVASMECNMDDTESMYSYFTDTESNVSFSTFKENDFKSTNKPMPRTADSQHDKENIPPNFSSLSSSVSILRWMKDTHQTCTETEKVEESFSYESLLENSLDNTKPGSSKQDYLGRNRDTSLSEELSGSEQNSSHISEDSGIEMLSSLPVYYHSLSHDEVTKQKLIKQLYESERAYNGTLRNAVSQYLQPLQNAIINTEQHSIIFQNIQQICQISRSLVSQVKSSFKSYSDVIDNTHKYIDNIGSILSHQIDEMCCEYESYCSGVRDSLTLLMELRKIHDFERYFRKLNSEAAPKLSSVLQKPIEHIKNLTLTVHRIYKLTDTDHHDYESLQEIVRALRRCSGNISQEYIRQSQTNLTSITSQSATTLNQSTVNIRQNSVDTEVQDIQNRLLFGDNTKAFDLVNTMRHVIYSGDLQFQQDEAWIKAHVVLFSDVLLITSRGADNFLTVVDKPVLLKDIRRYSSATTSHPCEWTVRVDCHHCETLGFEPTYYTFKASSLEQKCVWKNLLEQRMATVKSQASLTASNITALL